LFGCLLVGVKLGDVPRDVVGRPDFDRAAFPE
jgi:hypothetical protein